MNLLSKDEGEMAIRLARGAIDYTLAKKPKPVLAFTPVFSEKRGVFVTLTKAGELRGCIGFPYPVIPLMDAIEDAAVAAATGDPRFPKVRADELGFIRIEVTILTVPVPLEGDPDKRPEKVDVGRHGLIVRGRGTSGLLLPQVATEYNWDNRTFLEHTCMKAGLPRQCWTHANVEVLTFEGQIFTEHETG
ncbi:MAG: TIGR00296 family protein [Methanoregula sp.]|nr:TIGR00296 family protein [Methanoregula sp.]